MGVKRSVCGAAALCLAVAVEAATFNVTTLADAGPGSLRDALNQANASPGPDTITFGVTGTITLASNLAVTGPVTIQGPGAAALALSGNDSVRILVISDTTFAQCPAPSGAADYTVTISGLTLRNGNAGTGQGGAIQSWHSLALDGVVVRDSKAQVGGGVAMLAQYTGQSLAITNAELVGNQALEAASNTRVAGGAIAVVDYCAFPDPADVPVTIANSTIHGNRVTPTAVAAGGGALLLESLASATITDTRIYDNHVDPGPSGGRGGAIRFTGRSLRLERSEVAQNTSPGNAAFQFVNGDPLRQGAANAALVRFVNTTVTDNTTTNGGSSAQVSGNVAVELINSTYAHNVPTGAGNPGLIFTRDPNVTAPTLKLESSILYNPAGGGIDVLVDPSVGTLNVTANRSLVGKISAYTGVVEFVGSGTGNLLGLDPVLGPLAFNGGTTRTRPVLTASPAIDAGSNPDALAVDQRGGAFARVLGPAADIGAVEHPASCAGFLDVAANTTSCANVAWIKNRGVTLGCAAGSYCPSADVVRDAMAAFMNRLGTALSGRIVGAQQASGALDPDAPETFACLLGTGNEIPAAKYPQRAHIDAVLSGLAAADAGVKIDIVGALDWGGSPVAVAGTSQVSFRAGRWTQTRVLGHLDVPAGQPLAIGLLLSRGGLPGAGTLADSSCNIRVRLESRDGIVAPFDMQAKTGEERQ